MYVNGRSSDCIQSNFKCASHVVVVYIFQELGELSMLILVKLSLELILTNDFHNSICLILSG